ncbi:MAG: lysophospholipid acyltransferase family protein [Faecousia sp.]
MIDSREKLPKSKLGRVFAINHRQADDIVIGANAVGQSGYVVFGNPYLAFETVNGLGLWAYGMILLNRDTPASRKASYEKMKFVIEHGGNIIIYPEGYWNLDDNGEADECHGADGHNSENWLIQDINVGILRLAKETGCEIVPTVLHYDEFQKKRCYASRGVPFRVTASDDVFVKKDELVAIMRDMSFALMEKYSSYERATLEAQGVPLRAQWEAMKEELCSACDIPSIGYRLDLADEKRIGKAKVANPVITSSEAFAHLQTLIPRRENAFLFRRD